MKFSKYNQESFDSIGDEGIRTPDPLLARQVLSQLSYTPVSFNTLRTKVGLRRLELPTSRLSGVRSNRLSYKPIRFSLFSKPRVSLFCYKNKFDLASTYSPTPSPVQYHRPYRA